jgi:hypothetical protein
MIAKVEDFYDPAVDLEAINESLARQLVDSQFPQWWSLPIIDFGASGVGDPACDTVIAWNDFDAVSRAAFRRALSIDDDTWARRRGWAYGKPSSRSPASSKTTMARVPHAHVPSSTGPLANSASCGIPRRWLIGAPHLNTG